MTPEQIEQMKETMDPETHADGFTPFWGYVVSWEKYKDMAEHIIAQREQIEALEKRVKAADAEYRRGFEDGCAHMKEDYEAGERLDSHRRAGQ